MPTNHIFILHICVSIGFTRDTRVRIHAPTHSLTHTKFNFKMQNWMEMVFSFPLYGPSSWLLNKFPISYNDKRGVNEWYGLESFATYNASSNLPECRMPVCSVSEWVSVSDKEEKGNQTYPTTTAAIEKTRIRQNFNVCFVGLWYYNL